MKTRFVASLFLLSLALLAIITISDLGAGSLVDHQDQPFIANAMGPKAAVSYLSSQLILTFIEVQRDGVDGVEGIGQASSAMVSPDGKHVYVAGSEDNTVAAFSRHSSTGKLTFIESQDEGIGEEARYAAVSPDGKHVYVASEMGSTIAVFGRDGMTGNLTYVTTYDSDDICCIHDVVSVSLSPEGAHL
jgi:DNA-binding beta-propeller fold protein YncE